MLNILFYPDALKKNSKLYETLSNHNCHNDITKPYHVCFLWSYNKAGFKPDEFILNEKKLINSGCYNISKTKVANIFDNILVNPETYNGWVVRKNELQCGKDEVLLRCPTKKEEGFVYRKYIPTRIENGFISYRLYYMDGFKILYKSTCDKDLFYKGVETKWERLPVNYIPKNKLKSIDKGCKEFGFNFGEIDLLQDIYTNKFYVIDINNMPGGQGKWLYRENNLLRKEYKLLTRQFLLDKIEEFKYKK